MNNLDIIMDLQSLIINDLNIYIYIKIKSKMLIF
jgi:hypothetical protein